jgi:hypothetical protein
MYATSRSTWLRNADWLDTAAGEVSTAMFGQVNGRMCEVVDRFGRGRH